MKNSLNQNTLDPEGLVCFGHAVYFLILNPVWKMI
jgi:hypothetical protein